MTTIVYNDEIQHDVSWFKAVREKMIAVGDNTNKIDKQISSLEDAVIIYRVQPSVNIEDEFEIQKNYNVNYNWFNDFRDQVTVIGGNVSKIDEQISILETKFDTNLSLIPNGYGEDI
jgi:hypothetical protein